MIDAHCHLQFQAFEEDSDAIIKKAFADGVTKIINVGTQVSSSKGAVNLAEKYDDLYAIVGIHPHHADKLNLSHPGVGEDHDRISPGDAIASLQHDNNDWLNQLEQLTKHPKTLAIGEIGMDYYSYQSNGIVDPALQREVFIKQIELAHNAKLPLQIHNRHAGEDIIEILKEHKHLLQNNPGMFHCFAGTMDVLKSALELGFAIGFDGNITYKGLAPGETVTLKELAAYTPLDRIVIETDSPYLTPIPHRGTRNIPSYAIITARFIAEIKNISFEELVAQTDQNVYTIFNKLKNS